MQTSLSSTPTLALACELIARPSVTPEDAGGEGKVSILAPVGSALLGLSVGQHIDWPAPGGKQLKLTLLEVEYQPEAAGEYDR